MLAGGAGLEVRRVRDRFHHVSPKEHVEVPRNGGLMSSSHTCGRRVADDSGVYGRGQLPLHWHEQFGPNRAH